MSKGVRQVVCGVGGDEQHALADLGQAHGQAAGGGGLAHPALAPNKDPFKGLLVQHVLEGGLQLARRRVGRRHFGRTCSLDCKLARRGCCLLIKKLYSVIGVRCVLITDSQLMGLVRFNVFASGNKIAARDRKRRHMIRLEMWHVFQ